MAVGVSDPGGAMLPVIVGIFVVEMDRVKGATEPGRMRGLAMRKVVPSGMQMLLPGVNVGIRGILPSSLIQRFR